VTVNFLNLNGIQVPCSVAAGAKGATEEGGTSKRANDGTMIIQRRYTKWHWSLQLTPQDDVHSRAFRNLVLGRGDYWSFDSNVYSAKGLGPSTLTGSVQSAGSAYLGAGKLAQTAGGSNKIAITSTEIPKSNQWTVMHARQLAAGAWNHYIATFDGTTRTDYTNGVVTGSQTWLTVVVATGIVTLVADGGNATQVDELVILPYLVPTDWPLQMYNWNNGGNQVGALAQLKATGNAIEGNTRTVPVAGLAKDIVFVPSTLAGTFAENNQTFAFELAEA
jgi:hypothetical protein